MLCKALELYAHWQRVRTVEKELNALSDRELDDLGISRYDIPVIARSK